MDSPATAVAASGPATGPDAERAAILAAMHAAYLVAVIRTPTVEAARDAAQAVIAGGITVVEITLTVPGATAVISELTGTLHRDSALLVGAGTVLTPDDARAALDCGARFLVSPIAPPDLAEIAHAAGVPMILGALTPTEVVTAVGQGADLVKIFPVGPLGGPDYIRLLLGPFPTLPLLATGGTRLTDLPAYRELGVRAVSFTNALTPPELVEKRRWGDITSLARQAVGMR